METYSSHGLRVLGMGYRDFEGEEAKVDMTVLSEDGFNHEVEIGLLTFIGLVGIADALRPEVPGAIWECENAGVKVRMVTGDNKFTAL
jgi:P-type E1-E2 ATPase